MRRQWPVVVSTATVAATCSLLLLRQWRRRRRRPLARLPPDCGVEACVAALLQDGAVIVTGVADGSTTRGLASDIERLHHTEYAGADGSFAGSRTQRCGPYILATSAAARSLATHPLVLGVARRMLGGCGRKIRLSVVTMIRVLAGQSAQVLHRDDEEWPLPLVGRVQAGVEIEVSALWAISDFRRSNGATNVVVGSHGGHCDPKAAVPPPVAACEAAEMAEGSVLLFTGSVWHGAGASSEGERQGALFQYIPGWLHPEHNLHFAVAPEVSARLDEPELRSLLGFDGSNPFRLNAPGPLYATEYTGYPDREDADFSAPLKPQGQSGYMSRAY